MTKAMTKVFVLWVSAREMKFLLGVACSTPREHGATQVRKNPPQNNSVSEALGKLHVEVLARGEVLAE